MYKIISSKIVFRPPDNSVSHVARADLGLHDLLHHSCDETEGACSSKTVSVESVGKEDHLSLSIYGPWLVYFELAGSQLPPPPLHLTLPKL